MTIQLTQHFNLSELRCKDGTAVPEHLVENAREICERAQVLRDELGKPLRVISGFRTPSHNARVGARPTSLHVTARALDLACTGMSADQLAAAWRRLVLLERAPDGGLGVYPRKWGGWIHVDTGRPRRWRG